MTETPTQPVHVTDFAAAAGRIGRQGVRLLHTEAFTCTEFYTHKLLHTDPVTDICFYTNTFTCRDFYRRFCTLLDRRLQFRCIVLKPGRQHVSIYGYTVMEQPVARNLFQSLAAGIMLVEPQQSSDNSLCSHPVASKTSQSGITCHKLQKRQTLAPNSKPKFDLKNEAIFGFA